MKTNFTCAAKTGYMPNYIKLNTVLNDSPITVVLSFGEGEFEYDPKTINCDFDGDICIASGYNHKTKEYVNYEDMEDEIILNDEELNKILKNAYDITVGFTPVEKSLKALLARIPNGNIKFDNGQQLNFKAQLVI